MTLENELVRIIMGVNGWLWDHCIVVVLMGMCVYFTVRLKGIPFRCLKYGLQQLKMSRQPVPPQGEITSYASMMASLTTTIGMSSIIGVSTAIILGGFGAAFWMWIIAFLGLSVRYAEALLTVKYRTLNPNKEICGGPMYYMAMGLKKKWLAICFALLGMLGALAGGAVVHVRGIAMTVRDAFHVPPFATGIIVCVMTAIILCGGIQRIAKLSSLLGALCATAYGAGGVIIILSHFDSVPRAFSVILSSAFSMHAVSGGVIGASLFTVIHVAMTWGICSHHIGWGSASIAAAAAKTDVPGRQALITMVGFFLCIILSVITALVLFVTDAPMLMRVHGPIMTAASFVSLAFRSVIPAGDALVLLTLLVFGFTAITGWGYYGEKCMEFLLKGKAVLRYRLCFCACVLAGSISSLDLFWPLSNCIYGLMALCNAVALIGLSSVVAIETRIFFDLIGKEKRQRQSIKSSSLHNSS